MTRIVEIFWNARPALSRIGVKVNSGPLDPRVDQMFQDVRAGLAEAFPGWVTLVRIEVRSADPDEPGLRVVRHGGADEPDDIEALDAIIERAVERATAQEPA